MAVEHGILVKLHQCLFGYDDGHRLLSASLKLPEEAASLLLMHSDRVPGPNSGRIEGYWTGMPVPAAKVYALMRTWPAPEMPRPGCVWTHVVLIALADIARFPDLAVLESYFARPTSSAGFIAYTSPLTVDPLAPTMLMRPSASRLSALRVLRALYASESDGILLDDGEPADAAIFAAWSQQWPRLRRSFSFRTAGLATDLSTKSRFDLRVVRGALSEVSSGRADEANQPAEWELEAIDDQLDSTTSCFRRFLWRYGSDIRRGRERFRFLAQLFLATRFATLDEATLAQTLDTVVNALPDADDGNLLKDDLLSCGRSTYSLLPAADPIATLSYFVNHSDLVALPPPPEAAFETVHDLWLTRAPEILTITEEAANRNSVVVEKLLDRLSALAEPANFLSLSRDYPMTRKRVVRMNPAVLDSSGLPMVSEGELPDLLALLPDDQDLAARILDRLLFADSANAAAVFTDRFLDLTQDRVFDALVSDFAGSGPAVPRIWPDAVRRQSLDLTVRMLVRSSTTTALGALARWLGLDVPSGLKADPTIWAATLRRVSDDIRGPQRQRLLSYLLALALAKPSPGCELLFETAFESVHADIWSSRLPDDAFDVLSRFLPDVYWWQQWDTCRRLRLAVVEAYVSAELDPRSFRRLTSDTTLFDRLANTASDTKSGRRFLKRVLG